MTKRCDSAADRWEVYSISKVREQASDFSFAPSMFMLSLTHLQCIGSVIQSLCLALDEEGLD